MAGKLHQEQVLYEFDRYLLDAAQRVLRRDGEFVPLTPKAFDVLVALVESGGRVVDKEELLKRVWPDTFVEDGSLTQNISNLRKLLARSGSDPQFIQTVSKRGYRFVAPVKLLEPAPESQPLPISNGARRDSPENRPRLRIPFVISRGYTYYLALLLLSVAVAFRWEYARPHPLTDKDVLVLADFINSTGDPVFDGTLREALAYQLEQSPVLKVLDDEVMRQDLQLMRRSPQERVTNELARDICLREAEKAMLAGAIARMGKSYVIELKAVSCQNGTILARQQAEGADKDHVLQALAKAAQNMRAKLGESLSSIQRLAPPEFPVTTASLEAFQAFTEGQALFTESRYVEAIPFFQHAIQFDPNFAMAYLWLASASLGAGGGGNPERVQEYADKAYSLRDRVSAYERFWIGVPGFWKTDRVEALKNYELWARTYPRDPAPLAQAALIHSQMGEFEEALRLDLKAYRMAPRRRLYAAGVMLDYIHVERLADAKALAGAHLARGFDDPQVHQFLLRIASMEGDQESTAREKQWFVGTPEGHIGLEEQAVHARMLGQLRESHDLLERAADLARRRGLPEAAARLLAPNADGDALLGNCATARNIGATSPITLALCEDSPMVQRAEKYAAERSRWRGGDPLWNSAQLPLLRAGIEYGRGQSAKAVDQLQPVRAYERAFPFAIYLRGLAYLRLNKGAEAAAEFQRIIDHRGANWGPVYPLSYVGLARASKIVGDVGRALKADRDFLTLWKDADENISVLTKVRQEYAATK